MTFKLDDSYVDVAERIRIFREKHPEGSLQSEVTVSDDGTAVLCKAWAYRTPDDPRPGIGHSRLTIPGKTPYTRDSEVENSETSAWGRAIVAALAADTKKIASADEVAARHDTGGARVGDAAPPAQTPAVVAAGEVESSLQAPSPAPGFVQPPSTLKHPSEPPADNGDPGEIVLHFSKNAGKKLSELTQRQLAWYANEWTEKPGYPWQPVDRRLKRAAQILANGSADPEPVAAGIDEDIPF